MESLTHQVGAEPIIDRLHRLASIVEMDGTVMAVSFKGGACGENQNNIWQCHKLKRGEIVPCQIKIGQILRNSTKCDLFRSKCLIHIRIEMILNDDQGITKL